MYGYEEALGAGSGLAAQAPAGDLYFPSAASIVGPGAVVPGGVAASGNPSVPLSALATQTATGLIGEPTPSGGVTSATKPASHIAPGWQGLLDPHNNPALWILLALLFLFGWMHMSLRVRGRAGRARAGGGVDL